MGRLAKLREDFGSKKIGFKEYYEALFKRIHSRNSKLNAYLEVFEEDCLHKASSLDQKSERKPLEGIPIGIKDIISIQGKELNASSKILKSYKAPRSATVTERLERDGAIFPGRCNCDEFAMGSSNENTPFGPVKNPIKLERTAGGSSGGSAAAVRADLCVASLGTDTGGSIRLPAAFCGITGLRTTYGRVSRSGVIAFASSLDQVGPFADDSLDCAHIMQSIAGRDARDATSMNIPVPDYVAAIKNANLKGKKIGIPDEFFNMEGTQKEVSAASQTFIDALKREGASVEKLSMPHLPYGIAVYYVVATAEAASNLARYDGIRYGHRAKEFKNLKDLIVQSRSEGFGSEVKRRIMLGTFALSSGYYDAYYSKAQFVRSKIQNEFLEAFKKVDLIFCPTCPTTAFKIGEKVNDPLAMYLLDIFTVTANLAGLPGISMPIGMDSQGLPIGGQLIGRPFSEDQILATAAACERLGLYESGAIEC